MSDLLICMSQNFREHHLKWNSGGKYHISATDLNIQQSKQLARVSCEDRQMN
jgi:hypothetical protein